MTLVFLPRCFVVVFSFTSHMFTCDLWTVPALWLGPSVNCLMLRFPSHTTFSFIAILALLPLLFDLSQPFTTFGLASRKVLLNEVGGLDGS